MKKNLCDYLWRNNVNEKSYQVLKYMKNRLKQVFLL